MKKILIFLIVIGCKPLYDLKLKKANIDQSGCTLLAWYEELTIDFHLRELLVNSYRVGLSQSNTLRYLESCQTSEAPCLENISMLNNTLRATVLFDPNIQPDSLDISLIEIESDGNENVRIEEFNAPLAWRENTFPNGRRECGVQDVAKIDIVE